MSLPVFLKSKTFLVFVFVGTLALGTFSVIGAYLIKKGAGRQEAARAQTPNTCPAFQVNPTSAAGNWPNLVTATTQLYLNCSPGQNYDLAYLVQQTDPAGAKFTTEPSGDFHTKPCGSGGVVLDTFEIKKENLKDFDTRVPTVPTCASPPCNYKIYLSWSSGSEDPWKVHSSCQANFQIAPQLPACSKFEVLKNSAVVTTISPNDRIDLKAVGNVGSFVLTKVKFYYKKNGGSSTPVLIGEGQKTGSEHGVETWMYSHWTVPATFANGESYDFYAEPEDDHGNKCNPYQNASICGNCKTTVTVSVTPANPSCTLVANPATLSPGQTTTLTVTGAGGTSPYTFQNWAVTPSGGTLTPPAQPSGTQATWQAPASVVTETSYTASVGIKDSQQRTATCNTTITVSPSPITKPRCQTSLVFKNSQGAEITSAAAGEAIKIKATPTHTSGDGTKNRKAFFSYTRKLSGTTPNYCPSTTVVWQTIGTATGVAVQCDAGTCTALADWIVPATLTAGDYVVIADIEDADGKKCLANPSGPCAIGSYACGDCQAVPGQTYLNCTGCQNTLAVTAVTAPPTCKGFTLNKTQAKDTEEVTANLTLNSGSSAFVDKVFLHAATDQELANNVQHGLGPISYFKDKSGDQTTAYIFKPQTFQVSGGANKIWVSAENAQGKICTDKPGTSADRLCGCGGKTLTVTVCPTCQGIQMTPAGGTVSAGSPITFVATFKRGSEPSPTVSFKITKPGGTQETITCPKASPECTITSSGEQIVATLKYIPATAGQYLAKASASCGGQ